MKNVVNRALVAKKKIFLLAFVALFSSIYTWGTTWKKGGVQIVSSSTTLTISAIDEGTPGVMDDYEDFDGSASSSLKRPATWSYSFTTIIIQEGVKTIGAHAFQGMSNITTVKLPSTLTNIRTDAFKGCTGVAYLYYAGSPTEWASSVTFSNLTAHPCGARTSGSDYYFFGYSSPRTDLLIIEPTITEINPYAFYRIYLHSGTSGLCIPGTVSTIGTKAFYGATFSGEISVNRVTAPTLETDALNTASTKMTIYIPTGATGYTDVNGWGRFSTKTNKPISGSDIGSEISNITNISWSLSGNGVLTLNATSSTKAIEGIEAASSLPWRYFRRLVHTVKLQGEITALNRLLHYHYGLGGIELDQTTIPTADNVYIATGSSTAYANLANKRDKLILTITDPASRSHASWSYLSSPPWNDDTHWQIVYPSSCSAYSFHTGGSDVWNTRDEEACFVQDGDTKRWYIDNYTVTDHTHFCLNWQNGQYSTGGDHNVRFMTQPWTEMSFANSRSCKVGVATGAVGTIQIMADSYDDNLYVGFIPKGYVLKIGSKEYSFAFESGNEYRTEIFEYNSTNARDKVSVGIEDADGHFISTDNTQEMQHLFLKVSSDWASDGAKFSIYDIDADAFKYGFMTLVPGTTDLYEGWVDGTCGNVIFVRHNSTATSPSFDSGNKWNQTGDLALQSGKNYFTINQGTWNGQTEGWSAYTRRGRYCIWQNSIEKNWGVCFRPCHEFNATQDANWNNANNWSPNSLPTINHDVIINKPAVVNTTSAVAKSVIINQADDNTGQLVVEPGQKLIVANTIRKTTDGESLSATDADDITIHSDGTNGLGALVMGTHDGTNKATVNFTTLSSGTSGSSASVAQYVGTPFKDETNILHNWYNSWVYGIAYTSNVIGWERVNEGQGMTPFKGYCVFSADGVHHNYWQQGTLVASTNQTLSGLNWQSGEGTENLNNENLLANSWMAPIKISAMESTDFVKTDATVYIFNAGSPDDYGDGSNWNKGGAGQYTAYTVGTAGDNIIPSMQSFSVYTNASGGSSVTMDYSRIVYDPAVAGTVPGPNRAPRHANVESDEANKLRLYVKNESRYSDMLYMWEHPNFTEEFENGWDGRKVFGENVAPQLYAVTPDGNMAVNCVPTFENVVMGFKAGEQDNSYTFTFEYSDEAQPLYLLDIQTNTYTQITSDTSYSFTTTDTNVHNRFVLTYNAPSTPTALETTPVVTSGKKVIYDNHLFILHNGRIFSAQGAMIQ